MTERRVDDRETPETPLERELTGKPDPFDARPLPEEPIFTPESRESLRRRWLEVQRSFIDEPRAAVDRAEEIVREVLGAISNRLEEFRAVQGDPAEPKSEAETETLRRTLQSYRSLFERIVDL